MVVAIAALAAVGLIVVSISSVFLLRSYLVGRIDRQLDVALLPYAHNASSGSRVYGARPTGDTGRFPFGPRTGIRIYTDSGQVLSGPTTQDSTPEFATPTQLRTHADKGPFTVTADGEAWRVEVVSSDQIFINGAALGPGVAVGGVSLSEIDAIQDTLLLLDLAVTVIVLVGIGLAAASVVRVGLRPLTRMEDAAAEIAGGDLSRRVEDADPHTESGRLGTALNTMLVRIETAMQARTESERRLRQFLADAAHELRTPLTSIQGFAELYRRGGVPTGPDLDEAMGAIESEVGRMRLLVNDLLLLARLDEERPLEQRPVDLLAVAADTVRDAHVRVPARFVLLGPLVEDEDTFDPVTVSGDEARLRQVATNLVANALQHTPDDAEVVVRVGRGAAADGPAGGPTSTSGRELTPGEPVAVIEVADTGPGLRFQDAQRVFERLYRADSSRSRRHGGAGLGLSIVSAIVAAHGGRVELWTAPGEGARFRVLLPVGLSEDAADSEAALS